jgi:hypothetical protein
VSACNGLLHTFAQVHIQGFFHSFWTQVDLCGEATLGGVKVDQKLRFD